jgi:hypothetical protein
MPAQSAEAPQWFQGVPETSAVKGAAGYRERCKILHNFSRVFHKEGGLGAEGRAVDTSAPGVSTCAAAAEERVSGALLTVCLRTNARAASRWPGSNSEASVLDPPGCSRAGSAGACDARDCSRRSALGGADTGAGADSGVARAGAAGTTAGVSDLRGDAVRASVVKAFDAGDDVERKQLLKELKAQRDRLRERLPEVAATEKREGDARVRSYMLPDGPDLDLVLRYEAAIDRKFHKVMGRLRQVQTDRRAAEAAAGEARGDDPAAK